MPERRLWGIFSDPNKKARIQVQEAISLLGHTQSIVDDLREVSKNFPPEKKIVFDETISKMTSLALDEVCRITDKLAQPRSPQGLKRKIRLFFGLS